MSTDTGQVARRSAQGWRALGAAAAVCLSALVVVVPAPAASGATTPSGDLRIGERGQERELPLGDLPAGVGHHGRGLR